MLRDKGSAGWLPLFWGVKDAVQNVTFYCILERKQLIVSKILCLYPEYRSMYLLKRALLLVNSRNCVEFPILKISSSV